MTDDQVGLNEQLRGGVDRASTDGETLDFHHVLQVIDRECPLHIINGLQYGETLPRLAQVVGQEVIAETLFYVGELICLFAHTATKVALFE